MYTYLLQGVDEFPLLVDVQFESFLFRLYENTLQFCFRCVDVKFRPVDSFREVDERFVDVRVLKRLVRRRIKKSDDSIADDRQHFGTQFPERLQELGCHRALHAPEHHAAFTAR